MVAYNINMSFYKSTAVRHTTSNLLSSLCNF